MTQTVKTKVSQEQFQKKVEIEISHLTYFDRLPKAVAQEKAQKTVSEKFEVG